VKHNHHYSILSILLSLVCLIAVGCQHTISDTLRQQAEPMLSFNALRADPDAFKGRTVILAGDILKTQNTQQQTSIEILQKPMDRFEAPHITDQTAGRFIAQCDQYLDPAIYDQGRQITVAGKVLGSYSGQVGKADYLYPLISCVEIHLWPRVSQDTAYPGYPIYPYPWLLHRHDPWHLFPYEYYDWPSYRYRRHR
jgi:outer membrane lipoprotein